MNRSSEDKLHRLKYMGYCLSQTPPTGADLADFVEFAKFRLCEARGVLMRDPIWDSYKEESILVEYYAMLFAQNAEFLKDFENTIGKPQNEAAEILDWIEEQIEKNKVEVAKLKQKNEPEEFEFTPSQIGE